MKNTKDVAEAIKIAYYETDEEIGRQNINYSGILNEVMLKMSETNRPLGTTSVSCLILKENAERTLYVANCGGDSHFGFCRETKLLHESF